MKIMALNLDTTFISTFLELHSSKIKYTFITIIMTLLYLLLLLYPNHAMNLSNKLIKYYIFHITIIR